METTGIDLESKYTYFQPFPRLENMASVAVALEIWDYYYSLSLDNWEGTFNDHLKGVNKVVDEMRVPNCIKEKIKIFCEKVKENIEKYYSYHHELVEMCNCEDNSEKRRFLPYGAVWDTSGCIDLRKTAEKVLSCPRRLNDNDLMFEIISEYCLEHRIKDFPLSSLSKEFVKRANKGEYMGTYGAINHWIRFKEQTASDCTASDYLETLLGIFLLLANSSYSLEWSVYEYYWDFLDDDKQVLIAEGLIERTFEKNMQMAVFSKMDSCQLRRLYSEKPVTIINNFFLLGELELAKAAWEYVKSTIEGEQFECLIEKIFDSYRSTISNDSRLQFVIDLWSSAPDNLIQYVVNEKKCKITARFLRGTPKYGSSCSCEFLKLVLSRTTLEFRRKFLLSKGSYIILRYSQTFFSSLIEHCLDETDQLKIKERILIEALESEPAEIMNRIRDTLFWSGREKFHEFLTFFTAKPDLQMRVKTYLLQPGFFVVVGLWRADYWDNLVQFLNEFYHSDQEVVGQKKRKIVFSFLRTFCKYWGCYRPNGDEKFAEIENLMTQVLTPEEIASIKEGIIDHYLQHIKKIGGGHYNMAMKRMNIHTFVSWCYSGDEEKMERFRRTFPIDKMFTVVLREIVERYVNNRDTDATFSSLEDILRWKFSKKKKIRSFKRRQIHLIMRKQVKSSYHWKTHKYPYVVKKIIEWVFDGDKSQIKEFKRLYEKESKMKIIYWLRIWEETTDCPYHAHTSDESD